MPNRLCRKGSIRDISKCSIFKNLVLYCSVGRGSYGIVYAAHGMYNSKKYYFVIKKVINVSIENINHEYNYSRIMSEMGIGPKVYDGFYVSQKNTESHRLLKDRYTQYIVMEKYDESVEELIKKRTTSKRDMMHIISDMINLLYYKIFNTSIVCYDIKPSNFVYRKNKKGTYDIKLIDFGTEFCEEGNITKKRKYWVIIIILVQLATILTHIYYLGSEVNVFDNMKIFKDRMKYIKECHRELKTNEKLASIYSHYIRKGDRTNNSLARLIYEFKTCLIRK